MKNNKSQAAIEFLTTYGWAILGVMIVLGALTYFGIFNTKQYSKDICDFGDQWKCEDYIIHSDGWIAFKLRNNFGVPIEITKVGIVSDYGNANCSGGTVRAGNVIEVQIGCQVDEMALSDKVKLKPYVEFRRDSIPVTTNVHNQTADIIGTVQPPATCGDEMMNCHGAECEEGIDCGGPCGPGCKYVLS